MADVTPETVLDKISHGHLECPICLKRYNDPKSLKCRHNFCKTCLEEMLKAQPRDRKNLICCPVCRQDTVIPKTGIADLDGNFSLRALMDEVNQLETLVQRQQSRITCEACVDNKQATVRCLDCCEYLCQECHTTHKRMKKTIAHDVVTIDDLRSGKATYESRYRKEVPKCKKHDQQDLLFYCVTCNTLICTACAAVDHRSHDVQDTSKVSSECKQKISDLLKKVEEKLKIHEAAKDLALRSHKEHKIMVLNKRAVITQKADEEVARIRENELRLKEKLSKFSDEKEKQFQDLLTLLEENTKQTKNTLERVKNDTFKITHFDLLTRKESILQDLQDAEGKGIPDPVRCLTTEDFKQSGTFTQADRDVLNSMSFRPLNQPRPVKCSIAGKTQKKVSNQVPEDEAMVTPVQVIDQVPEDEDWITPVKVSKQVPEDEATVTPVQVIKQVPLDEAGITPVKEGELNVPHNRKIDKTKWRRVIGGPSKTY